ncbi:hypothetical protein MNBD_GAMMA26-369 [hydrothermal vent metagenome]|uniref:Transporter n=1 Tax=hydrothermal vent metagenome TaxID=652676 RepID=A0A3B1ATH0_9ZZZZ
MFGQANNSSRLEGLDLARFIAFVGMVIVNFNTVMVSVGHEGGDFSGIATALQGRAAATFVVLAGLGLGLGAARGHWNQTLTITLKRAGFLLILGLLNLLIFDADIIHYYAFYFLCGTFFLRASNRSIFLSIVALVTGSVILVLFLEYDTGWDWQTYTYHDLWTLKGFARNLIFNGWHPLVPWLAFFLLGILLSRLRLDDRTVQLQLLVFGSLVFGATSFASYGLMAAIATIDAEAVVLFSTEPMPPAPLYMLAGGSAASMLIGLCLLLEPQMKSSGVLHIFTTPGRQTLTLYAGHIIVGMGILEFLDMLGGQNAQTALVAAGLFSLVTVAYALLWARFFRRGPLESLMRNVTG